MAKPQPSQGDDVPYIRAWHFIVWLFSLIAGDVRSAVVAAIVASVISLLWATVWVEKPIAYTVFVNEDGYGQPKSLFDRAQKSDPKLNLEFSPKELRNVYVCEFRKVTGPNYTAIVVSYLDAYRDCFDVSQRGESEYKIFPNSRTTRLQQRDGAFFCKCDSSGTK